MEQIQTSNITSSFQIEEKIPKYCQLCHISQNQLLRCSRCKKVYYCGVQCQKKHWPTHKINCSKAKQNCNPQSEKKVAQQTNNTKQNSQNPFVGLHQFQNLTHIGSGNFSQIFKVTCKKQGKLYAIKQVQKAKVQRIRKQADLFMEKHCLSKLKECDYAIKLYRTFQDELNLFIQMECPDNGQLWDQCRTFGFFSQSIFKYYASHLVKAMSIIHNQYQIVHRDLKPQNILLNKNNQIKLIDFGTARDLSRPDIKGSGNGLKGKKPFQHYVGTPNYMAPQCIHNQSSEKKCDIYSLSGVFYFMKIGAPPFTGGSQFIVFKKSLETQLFLCNELFSPQLKDLILNMNKKKLEQRFDINKVMQHAYFKDVDFNNLPSYQQARSKRSKLEIYLQQQGKYIFNNYHKSALQGTNQNNRQIYDKQIEPFLQKIPQNLPFQISKEQIKILQIRLQMMKIQAKTMMNYFDDNSVGFSQIYNKDFNSAQRLINEVKNSKNNSNRKQYQYINSEQEDTKQPELNMKKKKNTQMNVIEQNQDDK